MKSKLKNKSKLSFYIKNENTEINKKNAIIETFDARLANIINSTKKLSERIVGYVPYDLQFIICKFNGKANKPAQITPLEKAVVGILLIDVNSTFNDLGNILGLDVQHDNAEKKLLYDAIENMRNFGAIEGDESYLCLTPKGKIFAEIGERPDTYSGTFEIFVDEKRRGFTYLKDCLKKDKISILDKSEDINLSLDEIKSIAEIQATNMHFPKSRYILESADWESGTNASYQIYVCFIQSVRDNSIRLIVYDDNTRSVINELSELIELDNDWKKNLFEKCITLACENYGDEVIDNEITKSEEQEIAEQNLLLQEDELLSNESPVIDNTVSSSINNIGVDSKAKLRKKALYDSIAFEAEIHNIFKADNPDEIWLLSPWIKNHAFISSRGPLIEKFLQDGGKIFISYSHPEKVDIQMVDDEAAKRIAQLDKQYPNFFYVELPNFHTKNVIEVRGEQCVLFTGSFNVLSFYISDNQTQVRREEMALAHHQVAIKKYNEFQKEFAEVYIERAKEDVLNLSAKDILSYKNERLNYFRGFDFLKEILLPFDDLLDEKRLEAEINIIRIHISSIQSELDTYVISNSITFAKKQNIENEIKKVQVSINNVILDSVTISQFEQLKVTLDGLQVKNVFDGNKFKNEKPFGQQIVNKKALLFSLPYYKALNLSNDEQLLKSLASLYYLSIYREQDTGIPVNKLKDVIKLLLSDDKLLSTCQVGLMKNKINEKNSDVMVIFNGFLFIFRDLQLGILFKKIYAKKVQINLANYPDMRKNIDALLASFTK